MERTGDHATAGVSGLTAGRGAARVSGAGLGHILSAALPVLAVCGLWLLMHPYKGIVHDSRLYAAQALHALHPAIFGGDLFFAFGSQDEFTLFTRIVAPLVDRLGLSATSIVLVCLAHVLWVSGAIALALRLTGNIRTALLVLVPVVTLPAQYAGFDVLSFGETFMTPRVFAEAGVMWALALLAMGRPLTGAAVIAIAASLHPLMAATGMAAGFFFVVQTNRRWVWAGIAAIAGVLCLGLAGIAPFDRLFQTMDPEWLGVVEQRNAYLFPMLWPGKDWAQLILHAAVCFGAVAVATGAPRRLLLAVGVSGLLGLATMAIGADRLHNLFVIQTQPFRALWLLHVAALMSLAILILGLWRNRTNAEPITAMFALAWLLGHTAAPWMGTALGLLATLLTLMQERKGFPPISRSVRLSFLVMCVGIVFALFGLRLYVRWERLISPVLGADEPFLHLIHLMVIEATFGATVLYLAHKMYPDGVRRALPVLSALSFAVGLAVWDKQTAWDRGVVGWFDARVLQRHVAETAQVYWEGDNRGAWFLLRRASYASSTQGAGIAFSRAAALEYRDRVRRLMPVVDRDFLNAYRNTEKSTANPPELSPNALRSTCRGAPGLDFMVLSRRVDGLFTARWRPSAPFRRIREMALGNPHRPVRDFYLYDCARLRAGAAG